MRKANHYSETNPNDALYNAFELAVSVRIINNFKADSNLDKRRGVKRTVSSEMQWC